MRSLIRFLAVVCATGVIAAMGGYEQGMYGFTAMLIRIVIFSLLTGVCVVLDEVLTQRKRAKRVAARKAQKSNKYEIIYSSEL